MLKKVRSPLLYPGGKLLLFDTFLRQLPPETKKIVSPFFGGGAIEINLALRGIEVVGYDICPHSTNFWKYFLKDATKVLCDANAILHQFTRKELLENKSEFLSQTRCTTAHDAALYFLYNRLGYAGIMDGKYLREYYLDSGYFYYPQADPKRGPRRVFPQIIEKNWGGKTATLPIQIAQKDFRDTLKEHPQTFAYLDPPYFGNDVLYRKNSDVKEFDHGKLYEILSNRKQWILSYHDCPEAREMYEDFQMFGMNEYDFFSDKSNYTELFIFSHDLIPKPQTQQLILGDF